MNHFKKHAAQRRMVLAGLVAGMASTLGLAQNSRTANTNAAGTKVWRLAVVPQLTPLEMSRFWSPIVQALGTAGVHCELVVYPSIATFEPEFLKGTADLVFLNPYHMVMAKRAHRYEPLLHDTRPLEGVLVVKNDGPVKKIEQLKDHRISFPAPNAFAASLYIRSVLEREHHLNFETHYALNHRNAIRQILTGDSAAAGVVRTTLEKESPEIQQSLRILYTTPALSPHPIAAHPRVPIAVRKAVVDVLLALAQNPDTKPLMAGIQMPNPVLANYAVDYAPLERLKIEKYVVSE
jgi:phosphonate transport system substrate-binding protein